MNSGRLLVIVITVATAAFIVVGTLRPIPSAIGMAGSGSDLLRPPSSPQAAVEILADEIGRRAWDRAYSSFVNKSEFTELEFVRDLTGAYPSLRTYATLNSFDVRPLHASPDEAQIQLKMRWSTVVGVFLDSRDLRVLRTGNRWEVIWPIVKEPRVPPQVIPVTYLRWDVIYRGPEDDWGSQDVEAPHVRIVDMHPVDRSGGVVILGELLNEDVVPAFVTVKATLLAKNGSAISTEDTFDKIAHILLPKQVTPFLIAFQNVELTQVDSIHMEPTASLVAASADPVIGIEDQHLNPVPGASLSGKLVNHSGQVVNVAHVLGTFYDKNGQLVWVADQYVDRALLPQTPVPFVMTLPADIARSVNSQRAIATTFGSGRL
jgi:hypothetical protein